MCYYFHVLNMTILILIHQYLVLVFLEFRLINLELSMLITRVNRWSLTYCMCLGIKINSQKSGVKSEELVVERSLKLDAQTLIGWESSMDPRYMDNLEKNTFKPCTPTMKKIVKKEVRS